MLGGAVAIVLVRGTGDVASAVALKLFRGGYQVVLHDRPKPSHTRRGTALADALFEGRVEREGIYAKYASSLESLRHMLRCQRGLPVADGDFDELLRAVKPQVIVDARLRKHEKAELQRGRAPLTIGLGPNFVAGETTDLVVETAYGDSLGTVIHSGPAERLVGEPKTLGGHGRERFVYAPVSGTFRTSLEIGAQVVAGQSVGTIDEMPVQAPLTGRLRGLPHDGAGIEEGNKIVEVDASETAEAIRMLGERPSKIAEGVLTAIRETAVQPGERSSGNG
jgi:xanthine dehydrogenase accessory factor